MVYVSNLDNVVVALKRVSGELEWRYAHRLDATRSVELELYGAPSPEPAGELLLAGFSDGRLVGLDIVSGEPQWQRTIGEGAYPDLIAPAVAIEDAALVSGFSEPLLVLDLEGRAVRWRQEVGGPQVPTVLDLPQGKTIFHGGVDGELRRIDLRTGEVAWSWDSGTGTALSTPVPTAAGMLVAASGGALYLIDPESGGLSWAWRPMFHSSGITATPAVEGRQAVVVTNAGYIMSFVSPAAPAEDPGWDLTGPAR
jgi:outer membrane protein assembly factor BamB